MIDSSMSAHSARMIFLIQIYSRRLLGIRQVIPGIALVLKTERISLAVGL